MVHAQRLIKSLSSLYCLSILIFIISSSDHYRLQDCNTRLSYSIYYLWIFKEINRQVKPFQLKVKSSMVTILKYTYQYSELLSKIRVIICRLAYRHTSTNTFPLNPIIFIYNLLLLFHFFISFKTLLSYWN